MRKRVLIFAGLLEAMVVLLFLWFEPTYRVRGAVFGEALYGGRPTSYWRGQIDRWMHQYPTREEALNAVPSHVIFGDMDWVALDVIPSVEVQAHPTWMVTSYFLYTPEPTLWDRLKGLVKYRNRPPGNGPDILWGGKDAEGVLDELGQEEKYREIVRRIRVRHDDQGRARRFRALLIKG